MRKEGEEGKEIAVMGFEPISSPIKGECSTIELHSNAIFNALLGDDSSDGAVTLSFFFFQALQSLWELELYASFFAFCLFS